MAWLLYTLTGLVSGPLIFWLAMWTPHRIEREEAAWLREIAQHDKPETFPAPHALWTWAFWRQSSQSMLFWVSVVGAIVVSLLFGWKIAEAETSGLMAFFALAIFGLAITDYYSQYLPDSMTLTLMWAGLLAQLLPQTQTVGIDLAVLGAALGYLMLWVIAKLYQLIRRQDGLGHGDMKLMAAAGAWIGPVMLPGAIIIGSSMAVLFQVGRVALRLSKRDDLFAFGPWLAFGVLVAAVLH